MYAAWSIQVSDLNAAYARAMTIEQAKRAGVQAAFDKYKLDVEQTNTTNAREFADATRALWLEQRRLQDVGDAERARAADAERRRAATASELLGILNNAKSEDVVPIGPAVRVFLDRVRREQRNAGIGHDQAAPGNPH